MFRRLPKKKKRRSPPACLDQEAIMLVPRHATGKAEKKFLDGGKSCYPGLVTD